MGERTFHFISGLPRAGFILTAAILRQNPRFHAGMSSPIASLFDHLIAQVSAGSELSTMVDDAQRARLLRGLFDSYYADQPRPVIFDTNRAWTAQLPALMRLFPDAKIICCVRDVAWVMDSLERQYRNNTFEHTRLFNNAAERSTVYTRVEALAHANRLVGFAWHALREACFSEYAERVLVLEYDLLTLRPAEVFGLVYEFLDEKPFKHDFKKVEYDAPAFEWQLRPRRPAPRPSAGKAAAARDRAAAGPVQALRAAFVLARSQRLQGIPYRPTGERAGKAERHDAGTGAGDRAASRKMMPP